MDHVTDITDEVALTQSKLVQLIDAAAQHASRPDELLDVARAAGALGDPELKAEVAARIGEEVDELLGSIESWEIALTHNKIEAWAGTGRRAALLAEAWAYVR